MTFHSHLLIRLEPGQVTCQQSKKHSRLRLAHGKQNLSCLCEGQSGIQNLRNSGIEICDSMRKARQGKALSKISDRCVSLYLENARACAIRHVPNLRDLFIVMFFEFNHIYSWQHSRSWLVLSALTCICHIISRRSCGCPVTGIYSNLMFL